MGSRLAQGDGAGQQRSLLATRAPVTVPNSLCPHAGDEWLFLPPPQKAPISGKEVLREAK